MALGLSSGNGEEEMLDIAGGNCDTEAKIKDLILICEPEIIAPPRDYIIPLLQPTISNVLTFVNKGYR